MKTPEEWVNEHVEATMRCDWPSTDKWIASIQLDAWRQGMTDAATIVHARGDRLADNGIKDTVRELYAEQAILAARNAKGETK